jgi:hypothetical protein
VHRRFLGDGDLAAQGSYTLLHQREWENTFPQLENLAGTNQDADILLLGGASFRTFPVP